MIVTKLIKQYPLMLMENVTLLSLLQQSQTKMMRTMSIKMSNRIKTINLNQQMLKWLCTDRCKLLTENDIKAIVEIRQYSDEPIKFLCQHLEDCDNDCPNYHHTRVNLHQDEIDSLDTVVDESSDDDCLMTNVAVYSKLNENNTPHCVKNTEKVTKIRRSP